MTGTTGMELVPEARIGPVGRAAVYLLACCPRMPTEVLGVLLGHRQAVTTAQLLARLQRAGLAAYQVSRLGPLLGSRPVRLWTLTGAGRAFVASRDLASPAGEEARDGLYGKPERWRDPARQRDVPMLVACYRLLATVASDLRRPVRVCIWEHPWVRSVTPTGARRRRSVRLPAAAVLQSRRESDGQAVRVLLLPDVGTAPLGSYRPTLQALIALRRTALTRDEDEPLLLVGIASAARTSTTRAQAWQSLLLEVTRSADERPLRARVLTLADSPATGRDDDGRRSRVQVDLVFALVARHPLLTRQQLASLLRTSTARIARLETELMERGWLRPVTVNRGDLLPNATNQVQRLGLVELSEAGRQEAARRLLLPTGLARRRHGLVHADANTRRFLRHLQHTLGANTFFVDLAAAATRVTSRGGEEALVEWRSAAACAHGRFRPDGYGCYRRGPWRFGFFLEYDRGTERSSQYAAKLATYHRYRDTGAFKRDYQGFPNLLVVTISELAEARFAHQADLVAKQRGSERLSIFLTTTWLIDSHPEGVLGPIWRGERLTSGSQRGYWLPRRSSPGLKGSARMAADDQRN